MKKGKGGKVKQEFIIWFKNIKKEDVGIVGGKGANLGEMFNIGLPIPPGFCVSASAYDFFLEEAGIREKITGVLKGVDVDDVTNLQEKAEEIQEIILNSEMPEELAKEICDAYNHLDVNIDLFKVVNKSTLSMIKAGRTVPYVAVRSSATAEDLPSIDENSHVLVKINNKPIYDTIKNIYGKFGDGSNSLIEVAAMKGNKVRWVKADQIYKHPARDKKLFKITTETGREIVITKNHSLITLDKDTLEPKTSSINELTGGEMVPVTKHINLLDLNYKEIDVLDYLNEKETFCENNLVYIKKNSTNWKIQTPLKRKLEINEDLAYFLGLYCAEGSTYKDNCVIITNSNEKIMNRIKEFLSEISLYHSQKMNKGSLRIYCKSLVRLLHKLTGDPLNKAGKGRSCKIKKVPDFIFGCDKEIIGSFLAGCYDGDGTISNSMVEYCSTSKALTGGVVKLLELLNIGLYIRKKKNAFLVCVPPYEAEKFFDAVNLEHAAKLTKLIKLVINCNKERKHPEFLNAVLISKGLSENIKSNFDDTLKREDVEVGICPLCSDPIGKTSHYKGKLRFHCEDCKKTFYDEDVKKEITKRYVYYDKKGRFKKGMTSWNKGLIKKERLSKNKFRKLMKMYCLTNYSNLFEGDILWDRIRNVEEIDYSGDVYDFTVPGLENFAAGLGGIITHNSASFAGQQATYLNVRGGKNLIKAVIGCFSSLFTARAIYYREKNNFDHMNVKVSVVVQKMINSEKSGVMFSINPSTNNPGEIVIEAGFGLGEAVVSGAINPDNYVVDKEGFKIKQKNVKKQSWMFTRDDNLGTTVKRKIAESRWEDQVLNENEIINLAKFGKKIEDHYEGAMDIEFAIENGRIYIVQARPVTTIKKPFSPEKIEKKEEYGSVLVRGLAASAGVASGPVKIIHGASEINKIEKGDILVTEMTNPDYVIAMQKANAIVTDEGGLTSHASIVSREMGIPAIVGTENATQVLKDGQIITVDGGEGVVYDGQVKRESENVVVDKRVNYDTITKIKVICDLPNRAEVAADTGADGVGLVRIEFIIAENGIHPMWYVKEGNIEDYVNVLVGGLGKIAESFKGKPVWARTSDIRSDEYRNLKGGDMIDDEPNPMIGWHGIRMGLDEVEILKAEFEAVKRLHENGHDNVGVMLPFVTRVDEVRRAKEILREVGLEPLNDVEFGVMIETPASVWIIEELCDEGISFISFGTNDLTQTTLGVDRNNEKIQGIYDEMHPAVLREIEHVIDVCKRKGVETSICGQAGSEEEMVKFLVRKGIDSISANMDAVGKVSSVVARVEKKLLLDNARKRS
ncbi:MAG: phosphoenolpyruvate synthase [Nanoarchaeota archaeon]|nr:phosphoenolpyruvate synthase [Nanoarchaeota archaeon]